uniref:Tudor domain-containing protein n=1 Tax=Romanomermis culicivorax TaxID=13658 RepID=A0A915I0N5_ROMCU
MDVKTPIFSESASSLDCTEAKEMAQKVASTTGGSNSSIPVDAMRPGGRYEVQGFVMNSSAKTFLRVYVSHVYGPDRFYFQLMENQNLLAVIMDKLQSFYTSPKSENYKICREDLVIGLPVVSIYQTTDGAIWHRGLVTDVAADRSAAEIFYVDYGTKVIQPEWSKEATTTMINFVSECPLICEVVGMEGNCFSVNLCDTRLPDVDVYLNDFLVTLGLAKNIIDHESSSAAVEMMVTLPCRSFTA